MILTGSYTTKDTWLIQKDSFISLTYHKYNRVDRSIAAVTLNSYPLCNACRFHTIFFFSTKSCTEIFPELKDGVTIKYNILTTNLITSGKTSGIKTVHQCDWNDDFLIIEVSVSAQN